MKVSMIDSEPAISINSLSGYPLITLKGTVSPLHERAVEDVIDNYLTEGAGSITFDVSEALFPEAESLSMLVRTLRISSRQIHIAVVANGTGASILNMAKLGSNVDILATLNEASNIPRPLPEYLTSRRTTQRTQDIELPLAA
jgi:hypothetical protein